MPEKRRPKPRGENAIIDMFSRLRTFFNWCLDSGYMEGSKAFARYREIDKDIKRDALKVFEAI